MSKGDEASYKAKIKPKEEGTYTVYTNQKPDARILERKTISCLKYILSGTNRLT